MRQILIAGTLVLVFALLSACTDRTDPTAVPNSPLFAAAGVPADGNGNKTVLVLDLQISDFVTCEGGATLDVHFLGFVQERTVSHVPQSVFTANLRVIFSNAAGETFVWQAAALDRIYFAKNGDLMHEFIGHPGGTGVTGRIVFNETTQQVEFVAGKEEFAPDLACDALT